MFARESKYHIQHHLQFKTGQLYIVLCLNELCLFSKKYTMLSMLSLIRKCNITITMNTCKCTTVLRGSDYWVRVKTVTLNDNQILLQLSNISQDTEVLVSQKYKLKCLKTIYSLLCVFLVYFLIFCVF